MINETLTYLENNVLEFSAQPLGVPNWLIWCLIALVLIEPLYYLLIKYKAYAKNDKGKKKSKIEEMLCAKFTALLLAIVIPHFIIILICAILSLILDWKDIAMVVGISVLLLIIGIIWWKANSHIYDGLRARRKKGGNKTRQT